MAEKSAKETFTKRVWISLALLVTSYVWAVGSRLVSESAGAPSLFTLGVMTLSIIPFAIGLGLFTWATIVYNKSEPSEATTKTQKFWNDARDLSWQLLEDVDDYHLIWLERKQALLNHLAPCLDEPEEIEFRRLVQDSGSVWTREAALAIVQKVHDLGVLHRYPAKLLLD